MSGLNPLRGDDQIVKERMLTDEETDVQYQAIFGDVTRIVDAARRSAARSINAVLTAAKWMIGRRIVEFEQSGEKRAVYGTALVERLAADLTQRFGRGFSRQNIQQMRLFYLSYPSDQIHQTVSGKFTHADAGQMHLYLNYAREHWMHDDENPPVGLILCSQKDEAVARYALDGLPNQVMAAEYKTTLPDEAILAAEIYRTRQMLNLRAAIEFRAPSMRAELKVKSPEHGTTTRTESPDGDAGKGEE